jgi:hypothetical protein
MADHLSTTYFFADAFSIFSMVDTVGAFLPLSLRSSVSVRMPARQGNGLSVGCHGSVYRGERKDGKNTQRQNGDGSNYPDLSQTVSPSDCSRDQCQQTRPDSHVETYRNKDLSADDGTPQARKYGAGHSDDEPNCTDDK